MSTVPYELIAAIVDELEDDRASLRSCSLVGRLFCSPSQRHLFRSMWLHRENWPFYTAFEQTLQQGSIIPSGKIKRVSSLLSESPHLATYVRDLTIDLPDSADEDMPLARVLDAVANLERFVLSGLVVRWGDLSLPLSSAILDALARPTLERLHLVSVRDVPASALLGVLSSVKVLSLPHSTFGEEDTPAEDAPPPPASPLEHLILSAALTLQPILSPRAPKLLKVRRLHMQLEEIGTSHCQRLFSMVCRTLTNFELDSEGVLFNPQLPNLPQLQSITLHISWGLLRRIPPGFANTLAGLPTVPLTVIFSIESRLSEGPWIGSDTVLDEDYSLKALHCQLVFVNPTHASLLALRNTAFEEFCIAVRAALPKVPIEFSRVDDEGWPYTRRLP
ncbi:hypothetical protein B0H16DRAFT_1569612 [Mycena metata]|uniref:F-box domain-containing protein n=1 Tax=Mycena metata TaxID=1033252 RepID=A0AAD7MZ94_9AGAR|nr:hypothetical protein B0H16DRAFT_1569612 [Mycena metata]